MPANASGMPLGPIMRGPQIPPSRADRWTKRAREKEARDQKEGLTEEERFAVADHTVAQQAAAERARRPLAL